MYGLKIARVCHNSLAEGPRSNTTLWVSGCPLRCKGCFNPELWSGEQGDFYSPLAVLRLALKGRSSGDTGAAFVGGEPMAQAGPLALSIALIKIFTRMPVTVYTGYLFEHLLRRPASLLVLLLADYLVDGPFVERLADDNLGYRGSSNQRVIDLRLTRKRQSVALAQWDNLLAFAGNTVSGPPALMQTLGGDNAKDCGIYGH